nr:DUF1654 domain-containing protein [uncultured Pseudomonas sp.]
MAAQSLQLQPIDTYTALARRIQAAIHRPLAQIEHQVNIAKEPYESDQDWEYLLEELRDAEGVTVTRRTDGTVHLAWFVRNEL